MDKKNTKQGLTQDEVLVSRKTFGSNTLEMHEDRVLLNVLKEVVLEPMFILLLSACIIYFAVGQFKEGMIMLVAIFIVAGISLFQEYRSKNAVLALKKISAAHSTVIRNGEQINIPSDEIVCVCDWLPPADRLRFLNAYAPPSKSPSVALLQKPLQSQ